MFQERFGERVSTHHTHMGRGQQQQQHGAATSATTSGDFDAGSINSSSATRNLHRNLSNDSFHVDREVSAMFHQNTIIARL
jgi:hypothetical protein